MAEVTPFAHLNRAELLKALEAEQQKLRTLKKSSRNLLQDMMKKLKKATQQRDELQIKLQRDTATFREAVDAEVSDFMDQFDYLKNEVVSLRALALAATEEKKTLAKELEERIIALATEKNDMEQEVSDLIHRTGVGLEFSSEGSASPDTVATRSLQHQLLTERSNYATLLAEKKQLESTSQQIMGEMIQKLSVLEKRGSTEGMSDRIEEIATLRASLDAAETQTSDLMEARERLEKELYAEKQARFLEVQARIAAENAVAALQAKLDAPSERLAPHEFDALKRSVAALKSENSQLKSRCASLVHELNDACLERDNASVKLQEERAKLAEECLRRERLESRASRQQRKAQVTS